MKTNYTVKNPFRIVEPEVSKAFYGELKGAPDYYLIVPEKPLELYLNILTPDITNFNTNVFSVDVMVREGDGAGNRPVYSLDGNVAEWKRYYEPFGGDWYRKGPEAKVRLETNAVYLIRVYNRANSGRYALATGEVESFPIGEILRVIGILPVLHREFFNRK